VRAALIVMKSSRSTYATLSPRVISWATLLRRGGIILDRALITGVAATIFSLGAIVILLIAIHAVPNVG
jgi:hypothetical protein